jgi:hypothetical protein
MAASEEQISKESQVERFTTIDDVIHLADELLRRLQQLGSYKHPLDVRRGRKGVKNMNKKNKDSEILKAGAKTYFFDLKKTKDDKPYLVITESRFSGDEGERERSAIVIFPEQAKDFAELVSTFTEKIVQ